MRFPEESPPPPLGMFKETLYVTIGASPAKKKKKRSERPLWGRKREVFPVLPVDLVAYVDN